MVWASSLKVRKQPLELLCQGILKIANSVCAKLLHNNLENVKLTSSLFYFFFFASGLQCDVSGKQCGIRSTSKKKKARTETHRTIRKFICTFIAVISGSSAEMFVYSWSSCVKTYYCLSGSSKIMGMVTLEQKLSPM